MCKDIRDYVHAETHLMAKHEEKKSISEVANVK